MNRADFDELASAMDSRRASTKSPRPTREVIRCGRQTARRLGYHVNPVGDGDRKTAAPGTYRPVGRTCPPTCPYLGNGCYAEEANVNLHQRRAGEADVVDERQGAVVAAAIAMVAAAQVAKVARLHVSGDGALGEAADLLYWTAIAQVSRWVRERYGTGGAWTYTHLGRDAFGPLHAKLRECGVMVRFSDDWGEWGAVTLPFEHVAAFRELTGRKVAKCLAQLTDMTCMDCRLCWERPEYVIAFDPHGNWGRLVADESPAMALLQRAERLAA